MNAKPNISKVAFWDVDFDKIDFEKESQYVISQVFNYGAMDDMVAIMKYYGAKKVREDITVSPWLSERALSFLSGYFEILKEDFTCYTKKRLMTDLW